MRSARMGKCGVDGRGGRQRVSRLGDVLLFAKARG